MATDPERTYPSELPVLALRETVVFPLTLQPLAVNRPMSIESVNRALAGDRLLFLALQNTDKDEPEPADLHPIGTIAAIRQMAKVPNGGIHVIVEGLIARAAPTSSRGPATSLRATVTPLPEPTERTLEVDALRAPPAGADRSRAVARERPVAGAARRWSPGIDDPLRLAYLLASLLDMKAEEKQQHPRRATTSSAKLEAVVDRAQPRDRAARAEGQDRIGGAAGDDRRAAAVLPAPAAEGDPGRARRRREDRRSQELRKRIDRREAARGGRRRSRCAKSIGSSG